MKLAKTLAIAAITAGTMVAGSALAASGFYGHAHVNLTSVSTPTSLVLGDGGSSPSRFGFRASSVSDDGTTFGAHISLGTNVNGNPPNLRHMEAKIGGHWGNVTVGQSESALSGLEESYWARTWLADGPGRGASASQGGFFFGAYRADVIRYDSNKLADVVSFHLSIAPQQGNIAETAGDPRQHEIGFSVRASGGSWTANLAYETAGTAPQQTAGTAAVAATADTNTGVIGGAVAAVAAVPVRAENILLLNGAYDFGPVLLDLAYSTVAYGKLVSGSAAESQTNLYTRIEFQTSRTAYGIYYSALTNRGGAKDQGNTAVGAQVRYDISSANAQTYAYFRSDSVTVPSGQTAPDSVTTVGLGVRVQFGVEFAEGTLSVM